MPNQQLQCPFCPKTSSRGTGLASHIRGAHPKEYANWKKGGPASSTNRAAGRRSTPAEMAGGFDDIVATLQQQKAAIERALSALRELDDDAAPETPGTKARPQTKTKRAAKKKGGIGPEGRKRLAEAMRKRWALKRTASQAK
jgi:hypothetical protein